MKNLLLLVFILVIIAITFKNDDKKEGFLPLGIDRFKRRRPRRYRRNTPHYYRYGRRFYWPYYYPYYNYPYYSTYW